MIMVLILAKHTSGSKDLDDDNCSLTELHFYNL